MRTFPMFNFMMVILHTINAALPHFENTMMELKRKFNIEQKN